MTFVEWLEREAKRLKDTAQSTENGEMWVGDTFTPSQDERDEAAAAMRQTAQKLSEIAERNKSA